MQKYRDTVADRNGNSLGGVSVLVKNYPAGTTATIYSDNGVTTTPNPLTTDAYGAFAFYAADGRYSLTFSGPHITTFTVDDVPLLEDLADGFPALAAPGGAALVGFMQSGTGAVARTAQTKMREVQVTPQEFGALGDGVTDDLLAIRRAIAAVAARGGGELYFPPTGHPYLISNTISVPNGVTLVGSRAKNFEGAQGTIAQWAQYGTWFQPTHASNPCVKLVGHGSGIFGISFIHNQPVPSGGAWAPNIYGYCIEQSISHSYIEQVQIINASHGIWMNFTPSSGGGTNVVWRDNIISAFKIRMRTTCVNDTVSISDTHMRNLYYSSDSNVSAYIRANTIGWWCGYTDNPLVNGMEFFEDNTAIYLTDETCLGNTHSLFNASIVNLQFNLPQVCMRVENSTTTVLANLANTVSQTGNAFGYTWSDTAFQLASNNVKIKFTGLSINEAGGQVFSIGAGTGGRLVIAGLNVDSYSSVAAGNVCISPAAGAFVQLSNYRIEKLGSAGSRFAGAGLMTISTDAATETYFFGRFSEATLVCSGSAQDFSTDSNFRPMVARAHQVRLIGQINITTAQAAGVVAISMSGISSAAVAGIDASTTGFKSFDSGWVDVPESLMKTDVGAGRLRVNGTNLVVVANGAISALYR